MKCNECEEIATVFCTRFDEAEGTSTEVGYCNRHAREDVIFAGHVASYSTLAEVTKEQLKEVLSITRATGNIPEDSYLPSGSMNPFYFPSVMAAKLTAEDIQRFIYELDESGEY